MYNAGRLALILIPIDGQLWLKILAPRHHRRKKRRQVLTPFSPVRPEARTTCSTSSRAILHLSLASRVGEDRRFNDHLNSNLFLSSLSAWIRASDCRCPNISAVGASPGVSCQKKTCLGCFRWLDLLKPWLH
jgi:hypothetical protein